ncbi:MAG: metallophosphoesterase [Desulfobacterales bacterium]|nr:metallophosphoesterase [Desulfobacterales bacterium]
MADKSRLLLFSDLHNDFRTASKLSEIAAGVDIVIGAGDFCVCRRGLAEIIDALAGIDKPIVLVPGNSESEEELINACRNWKSAHILHGNQATIDGITFFGIGGGIPVTPFGSWSYDFTEDEAYALLRDCPVGCVLVSHSPPRGLLDRSSDGRHLGSQAVRDTVEKKKPALVVCGHIHGSSGQSHRLGESLVINAGPSGIIHNLL